MGKSLREFIEEARAEYKKIGFVCCPAFGNEQIYFNRHGFNHLLRSTGKLRLIRNLIRKLKLFPYAVDVIASSVAFRNYQKFDNGNELWSLEKEIEQRKFTVVIKRERTIRYFLSIMDKK